MGGWVRSQGSRPELLEGGVALERLGERHATLGAELVEAEPAHTAKGKGKEGASAASLHAVGLKENRWVASIAGQQTRAP